MSATDVDVAWVWSPERRCFVLARRHRLPKRQRRLARKRLRASE